jgi:hypothetical protein
MHSTRIATITLKTTMPREVARFWRELLGYRVAPNHSDSVLLVGEPNEPALLIQPSAREPEPGAIHLDLRPLDLAECRARALSLGATEPDIGRPATRAGSSWRTPPATSSASCNRRRITKHVGDRTPGHPQPSIDLRPAKHPHLPRSWCASYRRCDCQAALLAQSRSLQNGCARSPFPAPRRIAAAAKGAGCVMPLKGPGYGSGSSRLSTAQIGESETGLRGVKTLGAAGLCR